MKEIIDKTGFIIMKNLLSVKDTIKRIRQGTDWEKLSEKYFIENCYPKYTKNS